MHELVCSSFLCLSSSQEFRSACFLGGGLLFNLGACWDKGLDSDLDQGLTIFKCFQSIQGSVTGQLGLNILSQASGDSVLYNCILTIK